MRNAHTPTPVMTHRLHVTADRHEPPNLDEFVAALLAFAMSEAAEEDDPTPAESRSEAEDD